MPRYVLANRRAGKFTSEEKHASRAAIATTLARVDGGARVISDHNPSDDLARRVVILDADAGEIDRMRATLPADAMLEPIVRRSLQRRVPPAFRNAIPLAAVAAGGSTFRVKITGRGQPLAGIQVMFYLRGASGQPHITQTSTNKQGQAAITVPAGSVVAMVEPVPFAGYWIMLEDAPASGSTIDCLPIAKAGPGGGGWWHTVMGIDVKAVGRGGGIKVGVIDTGCGPHPNLRQVKLVGAFVDGKTLPGSQATDVEQHGTHTTGLIGARPSKAGDFAGMAPACDLFHARVFKSEDNGPSQADLINAIDALSRDNGCDLINMSLGGGAASGMEEDCILDALQRGTLCICSAGNDASAIDYPGAYPECAAVSAIGQIGWAPTGTFSAGNRPQDPALMAHQNLFLATFSSFGPTLACAGSGVGIVSTVPNRGDAADLYMEMDGTSMASPSVCGVLATILAGDAHYPAMPRDQSRSTAARSLLAQHCHSIGLAVKHEGRGLPHV